jgi:hypothetical protein
VERLGEREERGESRPEEVEKAMQEEERLAETRQLEAAAQWRLENGPCVQKKGHCLRKP